MRVAKTWLVLVWIPIGLESGASFVNQSQSVVMQNQSKREITFDTQLKTALTCTAGLILWSIICVLCGSGVDFVTWCIYVLYPVLVSLSWLKWKQELKNNQTNK